MMATFLVAACSITFAIHYYFWARLVRDTALPAPYRTAAIGALIVLGAILPLPMLLARVSGPLARIVAWPAFVWMGLMLFLLVALLVADGAQAVIAVGARAGGSPLDPERRLWLRRVLGGAAAAVSAGLGAFAVRQGLREVALRELSVELPRLPRALAGTTIVQLTDVHLGPTLGREFLEGLVRRCNALAPDVVAITGDLVDGRVEDLREVVAPLAALEARWGVYFVTGNHEYYSGADAWIAELSRLGVRVLRNERVAIGDGERHFDLAGVDDFNSRGLLPGHGPDLARALAGRDPSRELVLLAHQPAAVHEAARHGVGLQLSGHTHGGQLWPWKYLVRLQQPYVQGLARLRDTWIYVSPGTGYWGPPMRLGTAAEITRVVLRSRVA